MSPAVYHASMHPWCFFVTLTFAGKVPPSGLAWALQSRWLDKLPPLLCTDRGRIQWLTREELGERNGRLHLHVLLGETPKARVTSRSCLALMSEWEKVTEKRLGMAGMARCRVYQPAMQGADYVLKGLDGVTDWHLHGANSYEVGKFSEGIGRTVRLARCLLVSWAGRKGNKYGLHAQALRDAASVKIEL